MRTLLRYALLRHECPPDYRDGPHWDLMLELPGVADERRLATWSLLSLPTAWAEALSLAVPSEDEPEATRLEDHRAVYLDKQGPLSGDRGEVHRIAGGPIEWLVDDDSHVEVQLGGPSPLVGRIALTKGDDGTNWRVRWIDTRC